jgi:hypothetical protein
MQPDPMDRSPETPIEDAVEQSVLADSVEGAVDVNYAEDVHRGLEVDEWDATEQARTVHLDEDYE